MFTTKHKYLFNKCNFSKIEAEYKRGYKGEDINYDFLIDTISSKTTIHPDYADLAGYITNEQLISQSPVLIEYINFFGNQLNDTFVKFYNENINDLENSYNEKIEQFNKGHFLFTVFGVCTAKDVYLLKSDGVTEDLFQLFMREAITTNHVYGIDSVLKAYEDLCNKKYTFATPTLINGGRIKGQLSSCFLLTVPDSIGGIYEKVLEMALISKRAGGIGFNFTNVTAKGSLIPSTGSPSTGIIPFLKTYASTARAVNQGGRRKGSFAAYLEIWHGEVFAFCDLRKNHGKVELRTRDLYLSLYINDLFMERVKKNEKWSLMCPSKCPDLVSLFGTEFKERYEYYERNGIYTKQIEARDLWKHITVAVGETGTPYIVNKDPINKMNAQSYAGTIECSNLCTEITEFSSKEETAVCNLATVSLNHFYDKIDKKYNYQELYKTVKYIIKGLNVVIDTNYYPSENARRSNMRHRPIGLGCQGLADLFCLMRVEFGSKESIEINRNIRETMLHASYTASMELCKGGTQEKFKDFDKSCYANGELAFDLWKKSGYNTSNFPDEPTFDMWDWDALRSDIKKYGLCNSLLLTDPPTATTSQLLGNNECFEPYTYNLYLRRTKTGEFTVINPHLVRDLEELGLWDETTQKALLLSGGSVQNLPFPQWIKDVYKTSFEIEPSVLIDMSRDRASFTCQSQSLNLFISKPSANNWTSAIFYGWSKGLKTLQYYLRRETTRKGLTGLGVEGTIETLMTEMESKQNALSRQCSLENSDECLMCGA